MKHLALIALCVLCIGASARKPGVYTVTVKVDTTYVKTGATEDGVPLFRQKIDTTETWASHADIADSTLPWQISTLQWIGAFDTCLDVPPAGIADTLGDIGW